MTHGCKKIDGKSLAEYADEDLGLWSTMVGRSIDHVRFGQGEIVDVEHREHYIPLIRVLFSGAAEAKEFNSDGFKSGKFLVQVPTSLATEVDSWILEKENEERERQEKLAREERERAAREERQKREEAAKAALEAAEREKAERERALVISKFRALTKKYKVAEEGVWDGESLSPLASVLEKLENNEQANTLEMEWLETNKYYRVIAIVHYRRYESANDLWALVQACSHLRKAKLPNDVLRLLDKRDIRPGEDPQIKGALLTTRGGALRDMGDLLAAKESATAAIQECSTSYYPYNLMGAILYEEGNPSEGDQYFERASQLGASHNMRDREVRIALDRSNDEVRRQVAQYLLAKDNTKYDWVEKYLR